MGPGHNRPLWECLQWGTWKICFFKASFRRPAVAFYIKHPNNLINLKNKHKVWIIEKMLLHTLYAKFLSLSPYHQAQVQIQSRSIPGPFLIHSWSFESIPIQNQRIWTRSWCYFHCATHHIPDCSPSKLHHHIPDCSFFNCSIFRQKEPLRPFLGYSKTIQRPDCSFQLLSDPTAHFITAQLLDKRSISDLS